jgi:cell division protein FtsW
MTHPPSRHGAASQPTLLQLLSRLLLGEAKDDDRGPRARHPVDWWIVLIVLSLTFFGLVMVFSASAIEAVESTGSPYHYLIRQGIAAGIGLVGLVIFSRIPSHRLARVGWVLYFACLVGLVAVFIPGVGHKANGAIRWIAFGSLRLQPSEFMKLALVLVLAERVNRLPGGISDLRRHVLPILAVTAPVLVLVLAEPDFGTTLILAGIACMVLFLGGIPTRWMATIAGVGVLLAVIVILADPYRLGRVVSWLDPWAEADGGGYQVIMGWVALHYGGLWGQGLGEAMSSMKWLPFAHTDFVAAVAGEELGFIRLAVLLGIYGLLIWRGVHVAARSRSYFGTLAAGSITLILGLQTLFNLGVIMGLVPPKGLVLPFMSYGASALIAHLWSVGVLLTVSAEPEEEAVAELASGGGGGGRLVPVEGLLGAGIARWGELARAWAARRGTS